METPKINTFIVYPENKFTFSEIYVTVKLLRSDARVAVKIIGMVGEETVVSE